MTWSPDWPQVLEAGWGLYFTVLMGVPFALVALRPGSSTPAIVLLAVAAIVRIRRRLVVNRSRMRSTCTG